MRFDKAAMLSGEKGGRKLFLLLKKAVGPNYKVYIYLPGGREASSENFEVYSTVSQHLLRDVKRDLNNNQMSLDAFFNKYLGRRVNTVAEMFS